MFSCVYLPLLMYLCKYFCFVIQEVGFLNISMFDLFITLVLCFIRFSVLSQVTDILSWSYGPHMCWSYKGTEQFSKIFNVQDNKSLMCGALVNTSHYAIG